MENIMNIMIVVKFGINIIYQCSKFGINNIMKFVNL